MTDDAVHSGSGSVTKRVGTTLHDVVQGAAGYGEVDIDDVELVDVEVRDSEGHTVTLVISGDPA